MDLTNTIRKLRESKGLTQEDLADRFGVTRSNYAYLEGRGNKLTVEQLEKIAVALGISVVELLTGEPQPIQNDERANGLVKRLGELEELSGLLREKFEKLNDYFSNLIYNDVAQDTFGKGYSKIRFYDVATGKKIASGSKKEIIELYKEPIANHFKAQHGLSNQTDSELTDFYNKRLVELEDGNVDNLYIWFLFKEVIAKQHNLQTWELREDFAIIDKFKQKAVNYYFFEFIIHFGSGDKVEIIFESGVITDKILLTAYRKAKYFSSEVIEEGYKVNEDLELVVTGK